MIGLKCVDERSLIGRLVELGRLEFKRERAQRAVVALGERGRCRRIEAAAEVRADRYVGAHADACRVGEQRLHALLRIGIAPALILAARWKGELPVGLDLEAAVLGDELMP